MDWSDLILAGGLAVVVYFALKQGTSLPDWLKKLINAGTGTLTRDQVDELNRSLYQAMLRAGATQKQAQSAVHEQNTYLENHPPSDPTFADDVNSIWAYFLGTDFLNYGLELQDVLTGGGPPGGSTGGGEEYGIVVAP
jgi:hypothetical protein